MKAGVQKRLIAYGALYVVFLALIFLPSGCADMLILHPSTDPIPPEGERRVLPFDGGEIEAWIARIPPPDRGAEVAYFVLEFGGNAERAEYGTSVPWPARGGVEVWRVNYPGFGGSPGPCRVRSIPPAALAAYDAIHEVAGTRPVVISGNSFGSTAALHAAAERHPAVLVLRNPPPVQNMIIWRYGWWNLWLLALPVAASVPGELNALDTAPRGRAPALFLSSENDQVVPVSYQKKVYEAYAGKKRWFSLAGRAHNEALTDAEEREIEDWILEALGDAQVPGATPAKD